MKTNTSLLLLLVTLFATSFNVFAVCAPQVLTKVAAPPYKALSAILTPAIPTLRSKLAGLDTSPEYEDLEVDARIIAAAVSPGTGRVVITLPDGTVVIDTSKDNAANTLANFQAKKINENHNTRVAILDAQIYDCGVGVETKLSSSTGGVEEYVAKRLGAYLKSAGTARISRKL